MKNMRITVEIPCTECKNGKSEIHLCPITPPVEGWVCPGEALCGETQTVNCSYCDGTGYQEEKLNLDSFKKLLGDV